MTVLLEMGIRFYADYIAGKARIECPDPVCGWSTLPNLTVNRRNRDGSIWHLRTDAKGLRGFSDWRPDASMRVLILGDCFVLGVGVEFPERFDVEIANLNPEWSIVSLGHLGYGTDQEFLCGRNYFPRLNRGDVLLLISYENDFVDNLRCSFELRPKPWFELQGDTLVEHAPKVSLKEILRDKSYLFLKLLSLVQKDKYPYGKPFTGEEFRHGVALYSEIVKRETRDLRDRGVAVIIAYHGSARLSPDRNIIVSEMFNELVNSCPGIYYFPFDNVLAGPDRRKYFLPKEHLWTAEGHKQVGRAISKYIRQLINNKSKSLTNVF